MQDSRSPTKRPPAAAPQPPAAATAQPPLPLPPHLQHAVHRALTDLQSQRLLYPQHCAAAEAEGASAHQEAEQRVSAALGTFNYTSALSDLEAARQAAKKLARRCLHLDRKDPQPAPPAAASAAAAAEKGNALAENEDAWAAFETFSAAVATEVDRRIATARLHPPGPAVTRGYRGSHLQQQRLPRQAPAALAPVPEPEPPSDRPPLGHLQQQEGWLPTAAAVKPAGAQRKRERSPLSAHLLPPALPRGGRKGLRQAVGRADTATQAAASPRSKRSKPHVAFGTRCDAPRPAPRGSRPVKLDAAGAFMPPQLPPLQPGAPAKPSTGGNLSSNAAEVDAAVPVVAAPAAPTDLLRCLAAALAGSECNIEAGLSGVSKPAQCAASLGPAGAGSAGLQRMLADLTAALQGPGPPAGKQPLEPPSSGELQAALQQHGIEASVLQNAGSLLQAVLDRVEGMELRATAPGLSRPSGGSVSGAPAAAVAPAGSKGTDGDGQPLPAASSSVPRSPSPQQLCERFGQLLQASGAGLEEVQQQLAVAQQAEAAAQRMEAAAISAAIAGLNAAAQAAEVSVARQLAGAEPPADQAPVECNPALPAADCSRRSGSDAAATATEQWPAQERQPMGVPRLAVASQTAQTHSSKPGPSAATAAWPAAEPGVCKSEAPQPQAPDQQAAALPPAELPLAPASIGLDAAGAAPAPAAAADEHTGSAVPDIPAAPAEGRPVQWVAPMVPGIPLVPPPAAVQQPWAVPGAPGCTWLQAGLLLPGAVPAMAQPLSAGLCLGQPALGDPGQKQEEDAAVDWEPPFSVASDEELPDSPSGSCGTSPSAVLGNSANAELGQHPSVGAEAATQQAQQAQQQQTMLDELAALSIRQYEQHTHQAEDLGCGQLVAADGAWDAIAAGVGGSPPCLVALPAEEAAQAQEQAQQESADAVAIRQAPAASPAAAVGREENATAHPAPLPAAVLAPAAQPTPPAVVALPRPPAPYQPLKAAAEAAAAARREEEAAGWRRLRQRADELVLWHEYAAELGISMQEPQPEQLVQAAQHSLAPPYASLAQHAAVWSAVPPAARSSAEGNWPAEHCRVAEPSHPQQLLWRLLNTQTSYLHPASTPADMGSQLLAPFLDAGSTCGCGTPASSSCLASEDSSSLLSSATTSSSLGVAARHKARALRYRLLRRRLEQATGLRTSLTLENDALRSELDCPSPATDASLATPVACTSPAGGSEQLQVQHLQQRPDGAVQVRVMPLPASPVSAAACKLEDAAAAEAPTAVCEGRPEAVVEAAAQVEAAGPGPEDNPSLQAEVSSDAAVSPPFDSHLADHLSSATPSECPTLGSRVPGGAGPAGEGAAAVCSGERLGGCLQRRRSDSSCSTLREVGEASG